MLLHIHHETRLDYSAPVTESTMEVRLAIPSDEDQTCVSQEIVIQPRARLLSYQDGPGTTVHFFTVVPPHGNLAVISNAVVRTRERNPFDRDPLWPIPPLAAEEAFTYAQFDGPIEWQPEINTLATRFELPTLARSADDDSLFERLVDLNTFIYDDFTYDPEATEVHSTTSEVLEQRKGVCQDFAHVMIAVCRAAGLPARYVSGYIYSRPRGFTRGAGASHAWCEVYLANRGWQGFDPTNKLLYDDVHVKIANGRDYRDVPPTKGVFRGNADEQITVTVQTVQLEDPAAQPDTAPELLAEHH